MESRTAISGLIPARPLRMLESVLRLIPRDRAVSVTREVLVHQGYEVVNIETHGDDQVVYYRRGNRGRGKGKGPPMKMIIRRVENRVVFVNTPDAVLVDINVRLRM